MAKKSAPIKSAKKTPAATTKTTKAPMKSPKSTKGGCK